MENQESKAILQGLASDFNEQQNSIDGETFEDIKDIDLAAEAQEPTQAILKGDKGFFSLGDLHSIKAKKKSGKSMAVKIFSSIVLNGSGFGCFVNPIIARKVLIFDTEQHKAHVQKAKRDIHALCGWSTKENNPNLKVYSLRDCKEDIRLNAILAKVAQELPSLVFIDGIADLLPSINDEEMARIKIQALMQCANDNNCAIVGIIHENKNDENARGWVGTTLDIKSASRFRVKKDANNTFTIHQEDSRDGEIKEDISFILHDGTIIDTTQETEQARKAERTAKDLQDIQDLVNELNDTYKNCTENPPSFTELKTQYMQTTKKGESTAKNRIRWATNIGLLNKNKADRYEMDICESHWDLSKWKV